MSPHAHRLSCARQRKCCTNGAITAPVIPVVTVIIVIKAPSQPNLEPISARCRQTNEGWTGNGGNNLHKYTDRHHFLHTLVIDTMLVNLIFLFSEFISFRVLLETPDYLVFC